MKSRIIIVVNLFFVIFLSINSVCAQEAAQEEILVKPGILASTGSYTGRANIATSKSADVQDIDSRSPVSAKVSRERGDRCIVTFTNNSEDTYSLTGNLLIRRGTSENKRFFSITVPAGQSQDRSFGGCPASADSVAVDLSRATKR